MGAPDRTIENAVDGDGHRAPNDSQPMIGAHKRRFLRSKSLLFNQLQLVDIKLSAEILVEQLENHYIAEL